MKLTVIRNGFSVAIIFAVLASNAYAEEAVIYGGYLPAWQGGAFRPAGTNLSCVGIDKDGRCWDGNKWHTLYPSGPRHFSLAQGQVDCMAILKVSGACWDGQHWYKLPFGKVFGVVLPGWEGGAFRTTPLPPDADQ